MSLAALTRWAPFIEYASKDAGQLGSAELEALATALGGETAGPALFPIMRWLAQQEPNVKAGKLLGTSSAKQLFGRFAETTKAEGHAGLSAVLRLLSVDEKSDSIPESVFEDLAGAIRQDDTREALISVAKALTAAGKSGSLSELVNTDSTQAMMQRLTELMRKDAEENSGIFCRCPNCDFVFEQTLT